MSKNAKTVGDLSGAPYNPRVITDRELELLGNSMAEFGDLSGVVVNVRTGNMVGGHQRLRHLDEGWAIDKHPHQDETGTIALGYIETPWGRFTYREVDWDSNRERLANLAANKHGGSFDEAAVAVIMQGLDQVGELDLTLTGFDQEEINAFLAPDGDEFPDIDLGSGEIEQTEAMQKYTIFIPRSKVRSTLAAVKEILQEAGGAVIQ